MLTFSSFLVFACPEEDPESVGGPVTDGNSSSTTSGRSGNRLSGGLSSSSSNGASINSDCWGTVTAYGYPGPGWSWAGSFTWTFIGSSSGGGNNAVVPSPDKLKFCRLKDELNALVSALPVTGTVDTGYSVAQGSLDLFSAAINAGYNDIETYIANDMRNPPQMTGRLIDWYTADINWNLYNTWQQFPANPLPQPPGPVWNPSNSYPTQHNDGSAHIFANFLHQIGQGSGISTNIDQLLAGEDPQPEIGC